MARLDTGWHAHPKVLGLGLQAMGLHAWSISYCDSTRSDGFIPHGAWPSLPGAGAAVKRLLDAGMWERFGDGFRLHDYLDWNRSKSQIESEQADNRQRVKRHRNGRSNGVTSAGETPDSDRTYGINPRAPNPGPNPGTSSSVSLPVSGPGPVARAKAAALIAAAAASKDDDDDDREIPDEVRERLQHAPLA